MFRGGQRHAAAAAASDDDNDRVRVVLLPILLDFSRRLEEYWDQPIRHGRKVRVHSPWLLSVG